MSELYWCIGVIITLSVLLFSICRPRKSATQPQTNGEHESWNDFLRQEMQVAIVIDFGKSNNQTLTIQVKEYLADVLSRSLRNIRSHITIVRPATITSLRNLPMDCKVIGIVRITGGKYEINYLRRTISGAIKNFPPIVKKDRGEAVISGQKNYDNESDFRYHFGGFMSACRQAASQRR